MLPSGGKNMCNSLGYYVPRWAAKRILKRKCNCGHQFSKENIVQVGIRKTNQHDRISNVLSIETMCPKCEKRSLTTFAQEMDLRQLICSMLEEMQKLNRINFAKENEREFMNKSKISDKEVKDFKDKLKKFKSYDELLNEFGINLEE